MAEKSYRRLANQGAPTSPEVAPIADEPDARVSTRERLGSYWSSSWPWILLVSAIVTMAAVLRFWTLGKQGLWFDELWTVAVTMSGPGAAVRATTHDVNPPLFYVLESLAMPLFGRSDAALRVVPAIEGVLSTAFMYLAGSKLFNRETGAWAAALFAVSAIAVEYSQEVRMYSQLMLFSAILLWVFALLIERPSIGRTAATGLVLACLLYTHVFGYMVAPVLLSSVLVIPRLRERVGRQTLIACMIAATLFLPWAFVVPAQVRSVRAAEAAAPGGFWIPAQIGAPGAAPTGGWWMLRPANVGNSMVDNLIAFSPGEKLLPSAIFIGLLIVGMAALPRVVTASSENSEEEGVRESDLAYLLAALAFIPLLVGLVISKYVTPVHTVRNTLVCLPAAYVLAAHGGAKLKRPFSILALLMLLVFGLISHSQLRTHNYKGEWLQTADLLAVQPNAGVLAENYNDAFMLETYPKLHNRSGSPNVVFAGNLSAAPAEAERTSLEVVGIPAFISSFNEMYVVSETASSTAAAYMDDLPGWKLARTEKIYNPVVRLYTRVE